MSERDTQFAGFAKLLWEEVARNVNRQRDYLVNAELLKQEEIQIIAQRAYDFVCHVVDYLDDDVAWLKQKGYTSNRFVENDIPDMTKWPEVTS